MRARAFLLCVLVFAAAAAHAVEPDEILADPGQEARARAISAELRCLVCQSQSIEDSNAPLARDLRLIVRERIKAGDSDEAVIDYVAARYGDYVRLKPPFTPQTWALWLGPLIAILVAGLFAARAFRRRRAASETPLGEAEQAALSEALKDPDR